MSRNLGCIDCTFCHGEVKLVEAPRPVTREDVGRYYDTHEGYGYAGMIAANAICVDCCAKYLAWIDLSACVGYGRYYDRGHRGDREFIDLSHRSTFDDEPGPEDMPDEIVVRQSVVTSRTPWPKCPGGCGAKARREKPEPGDYCPVCWKKERETSTGGLT